MESDDHMNLRVASFSCYLDTDKDNLVRRISSPYSKDHTKDNTLTNLKLDSFSYNSKKSGENFTFPKTTPKDGEISIFGADKYFNMKLEYPSNGPKHDDRPVNLAQVGSDPNTIKPIRTPSLCSEASSWNSHSQTALLQRVGSHKSHKKPSRRSFFAGFGCHARCFDKKGVQINYYSPNPNRALAQIPNHGPEIIAVKKPIEVANLDESRNSIEVFGSSTNSKGNNIVATNMERKLSILTWDAIIPRGQHLPTSKSNTICDDMASDASSDLFEIENISGSIYPISTTDNQADPNDDVASSCMSPTSHYAPSEASIQWSVVTASAADYSSVDYIDETSVSVVGDTRNNKSPKKIIGLGGKEGHKGGPVGGLLGCKSHKAVDVAENTRRKTNDQKPKGMDLCVSIGKSQGMRGRVKDIETLQLPRSFDSSGFSL